MLGIYIKQHVTWKRKYFSLCVFFYCGMLIITQGVMRIEMTCNVSDGR